jgi:hypothetical protein
MFETLMRKRQHICVKRERVGAELRISRQQFDRLEQLASSPRYSQLCGDQLCADPLYLDAYVPRAYGQPLNNGIGSIANCFRSAPDAPVALNRIEASRPATEKSRASESIGTELLSGIRLFQPVRRSGHATRTSAQSYLVNNAIASSLCL